jgi:predicted nucleic acid-binding protein
MTDPANQLLNAFDALPPDDRREVAAAVLRRVLDEAPAEFSDEALVTAAEELFLQRDAAEGEHGEP